MSPNIKLGISQWFMNKQNNAPERDGSNAYAYGAFSVASLTTEQIIKHVMSGKAFCVSACKKNWRHEDNFASAQLIGIDYDHNTSVKELVANKFIGKHAFLVYATPSSTPENPRSRVVFALDMPIESLPKHNRDQQWKPKRKGRKQNAIDYRAYEITPVHLSNSRALKHALVYHCISNRSASKREKRGDGDGCSIDVQQC